MTRPFGIVTAALLLSLTGAGAAADFTGGTTSGGLQQAVGAFQQADYSRSLELLSSLQPSPQRDYYIGLSELQLGNSKRAVELLRQLTVDQPDNADAFYALAAAWFGRLEEVGAFGKLRAFRNFRRNLDNALALQPEHIEANLVYVLFLLEAPRFLGESKQRIDARIDALAELDGAYAEYLRGYRARKAGDSEVAEQHFKRAVALEALPRATYALASLYLDAGRYDQAIASALELAAASEVRWDDPGHVDAHWLAARAYLGKGQVSEAKRHFRQALALCPAPKACPGLQAESAATGG